MIESVEHIKPILALNTLVMVLFTMAICFTKVGYKHPITIFQYRILISEFEVQNHVLKFSEKTKNQLQNPNIY